MTQKLERTISGDFGEIRFDSAGDEHALNGGFEAGADKAEEGSQEQLVHLQRSGFGWGIGNNHIDICASIC